MKKIMFVCTGNICRSAMAEGYLKMILNRKKINDIYVCSSGLYAEDGEEASYLAKKTMEEYDVDLSNHKATNIKNSPVQEMDVILCATLAHKQIMVQAYPELKEKVYTIKEYAYGENCEKKDISDPWGYDSTIYKRCAEELVDAIDTIVINMQKNIDNELK